MRHTHRVQKQASFSHLGQFKLPKLPSDQQWLFWVHNTLLTGREGRLKAEG